MRRLRSAAMVIALVASASTASAEIKTKVVDYTAGGTALQGFIAWDDASTAKRPGILVVHEWWGHNEHARNPRAAWPRPATSASPSTCTARASWPRIPTTR